MPAGSSAHENVNAEPPAKRSSAGKPTASQLKWLSRGLTQPGGKLPLFDALGQRVSERTVQACLDKGWVVPWFDNPLKPGWMVCKLTDAGRSLVEGKQA